MKGEKKSVVFVTDGAFSLPEAWKNMEHTLQLSGASLAQVSAMKLAFYLGAAQAVTRIHEAFEDDDRDVWFELHADIDGVLQAHRGAGHA